MKCAIRSNTGKSVRKQFSLTPAVFSERLQRGYDVLASKRNLFGVSHQRLLEEGDLFIYVIRILYVLAVGRLKVKVQ